MKKRLVLASSSPRRQALLKLITEDFDALSLDVDESTDITDPVAMVEFLAQKKAEATAAQAKTPSVILGADTIVVKDGKILGKPKDKADAKRMLKMLSGTGHDVYTGYCLIDTETKKVHINHEKTEVVFCEMTEEEIDVYIATKEPMDKAGAYGIQGFCAKFISGINGDYYCVMGFPVAKIYKALNNFMKD